MLIKVLSCTIKGMEPFLVEVEVYVGKGLPGMDIIGLPDLSVRESKDRVKYALKNSRFEFPPRKIIINLAPASIKKAGPGFDLAIAVGILVATGQIKVENIGRYVFVGELSFDGKVKSIPGILPMSKYLASINENNEKILVISEENKEEASLGTANAFVVGSLISLQKKFNNEEKIVFVKKQDIKDQMDKLSEDLNDFKEVKGQNNAKRGLEIAAAGGHNLLMTGVPGSGKSMLAKCLPGIMPPLTSAEALETSSIYSIAGLLEPQRPIITTRPFRSPHHTASLASIVGGGVNPKPGELTLATNGVLFMDEMSEFRRDVLEGMRQPLENRCVTLTRNLLTVTYPAKFQLIGAANPCYCGYFGDPQQKCICTQYQIDRYRGKISGPLLDRIDIHIDVPRLSYEEIGSESKAEASALIRARVAEARETQNMRFAEESGIECNAFMSAREVQKYCILDNKGKMLLKKVFQTFNLSGRSYERILKISRTIADLDRSTQINAEHVAEAINFRCFDR